jgi:hypothetical protein
VDLWARKVANPALSISKSPDVIRVDSLKWSTASTLDFAASWHLARACVDVPATPVDGRIAVGGLEFK